MGDCIRLLLHITPVSYKHIFSTTISDISGMLFHTSVTVLPLLSSRFITPQSREPFRTLSFEVALPIV